MKAKKIIYIVLVFYSSFSFTQTEDVYKIRTIAFYNVENLFDTINNPKTSDDDRTPDGKYHWDTRSYQQKLENIAKVLSEIGGDVTHTTPDIIGLAETENIEVLEDLINTEPIKQSKYGIIHRDSKDERGIDVALLYKKEAFVPLEINYYPLILTNNDGYRDYTREILLVSGFLDGEKIHFIVNHWPSRRGGELNSRSHRIAAATINKKIIDSIQKLDAKAKIISMGDFNDGPFDISFKKVLRTISKKKELTPNSLFNPMEKFIKKGVGSLAYRDKWNLFDQLFFTAPLINEDYVNYSYWKAGIFKRPYLITQNGRYKGYPFRSYANGNYTGGYSDHFPVYLFLIRRVE